MEPQQQIIAKVIKPDQNTLQVRILSPKKIVFLGKAQAVSSKNSAGKFDILAQHANFITLIKNTPLIVLKESGESIEYQCNLAIVLAVNNTVTVYTDIDNLGDAKLN